MKNLALILASLLAAALLASAAESQDERIIDLDPEVVRMMEATPVAIVQPVPALPDSIAKIDGYVLLRFDISENGRLSNVEVVEATHKKLAKFSLGMVREWIYSDLEQPLTAIQPILFEAEKGKPTLYASM